jgi:DNA mismatch repair protein MutH
LERQEAIEKLKLLAGRNLHELAKEYAVTVRTPNGNVNKGWAGHVCERHLGIPINSAQSPNFGSWELKSVPLKRLKNGHLSFKETMAITMIDPYQVSRTPFEQSHLLAKLKKAVCVARIVGSNVDEPTIIHSIVTIDLESEVYEIVKKDYELVRECLNDPLKGFAFLTGKMGIYIQPRTKGAGHGSQSRAFYARPIFLSNYINLTSESLNNAD